MYCKKCGRKLNENIRFCDRCGSSVSNENKQKSKKKELEELAQVRMARSEQRKQREINKKSSKKRGVSDRTVIIAIIAAVLIILIVPAIISYNIMVGNSENALWRTQDGSAKINATPTPTPTPKTDDSGTAYTLTENINEDGYKEFKFDGMTFLYPSDFSKTSTGGESRLKVIDSAGDGVIELKVENAVSGKPQELMMEYAQADAANEVQSSRAGDNWYNIDIVNSGMTIHRKCVIINGLAVSYDFTYSTASKYISLYERYIEYMDNAFKY